MKYEMIKKFMSKEEYYLSLFILYSWLFFLEFLIPVLTVPEAKSEEIYTT